MDTIFARCFSAAVIVLGGALMLKNLFLPAAERSEPVFFIGCFFVAVGFGAAVPRGPELDRPDVRHDALLYRS